MKPGERVGVRGSLQPFVELRDVDRRRDLRADRLHQREVALGERMRHAMRNGEDADRSASAHQRDDDLRADLGIAEIARIEMDVVDELGLTMLEHPA